MVCTKMGKDNTSHGVSTVYITFIFANHLSLVQQELIQQSCNRTICSTYALTLEQASEWVILIWVNLSPNILVSLPETLFDFRNTWSVVPLHTSCNLGSQRRPLFPPNLFKQFDLASTKVSLLVSKK